MKLKNVLITLSFVVLSPSYPYTVVNAQSVPFTSTTTISDQIDAVWGVSAPIGRAISYCESGLRQYDAPNHVLRGRVNPADAGVFQINVEYHSKELLSTTTNIYTPIGNIMFAKHLYDQSSTSPWRASEKCWKPLLSES